MPYKINLNYYGLFHSFSKTKNYEHNKKGDLSSPFILNNVLTFFKSFYFIVKGFTIYIKFLCRLAFVIFYFL